jgi:hypothetical protein
MDRKPEVLDNLGVFWNRQTLQGFAKATFRHFKTVWKAQVDQQHAERKKMNERTNRWLGRRREVCIKLGIPVTTNLIPSLEIGLPRKGRTNLY